jgi:hypothetical protein
MSATTFKAYAREQKWSFEQQSTILLESLGQHSQGSLKSYLENAKRNNGNVKKTITTQALNPIVQQQFKKLCKEYIN